MRKTGQHRGATLYGMTVDDERSQANPVVVVLMGVSGSGKTTVAAILSEMLHWDFEEGDALHPEANVKKMAAGEPLTDADRWPWLDIVEQWMAHQLAEGRSGIITCSALKRSYRDVLRRAGTSGGNSNGSGSIPGTDTTTGADTDTGRDTDTGSGTGTGTGSGSGNGNGNGNVRIVYLRGAEGVITERQTARQGHFMPASLMHSQFETLEVPTPDEGVITVDVGPAPRAIAREIVTKLGLLVA
ncbi:gluconokinase [Glaciibacter flavus]